MSTAKLVIGVSALFYIITCLAIIDVSRKNFSSLPIKAIWGIIAFIPFIGGIIYFIFGSRRGTKKNQ